MITTFIKYILLTLTLINTQIIFARDITIAPLTLNAVKKENIELSGNMVKALHFNDAEGEHLLLVTKSSQPSKNTTKNKNRIERHELKAADYIKVVDSWVVKWVIKDSVDCPGLDSEANFYSAQISVSDVNNDDYAEITVPYNLFCGGGVDSKIIKIIMRTKELKFALRGESRVVIAGQESFGGEMKLDASLKNNSYITFKRKIEEIWDAIYIEHR